MLFLAIVGPTAGRWFVDVSCSVPPKHFIRGEWFVSIAALTGWSGSSATRPRWAPGGVPGSPSPSASASLRRAARLLSVYGYLTSDPSFRPVVLITRLPALVEAIALLRDTQHHAARAASALSAAERLHTAQRFYAVPPAGGPAAGADRGGRY